MYAPSSLIDLAERTEFEARLLQTVYKIAEDKLTVFEDGLVFPPDGGAPRYPIGASISMNLGDWRPGFLKEAAPLVFITAFKLLDMLLEWVLVENGHRSTFRFAQKVTTLTTSQITFPSVIETRPWLRERLVGLYKQLDPLRGTIMHDRHFAAADGEILVSSSRGNTIGPVVHLSAVDLRNLALVLVATLRYVQSTWILDAFREKRLRRALDDLAPLHLEPSLGQLEPVQLFARRYVIQDDPIDVDLGPIRSYLTGRAVPQDHVFTLRLIVMSKDGAAAEAFLVPWSELQSKHLRLSQQALTAYAVPLPADVDVAAIAHAMKLP